MKLLALLLVGCLGIYALFGLLSGLITAVSTFITRHRRERMRMDIERLRQEMVRQLRAGSTPSQVSRNLRVPLVVVEQELKWLK